jgi:hypothetical protein
MRCRKASDAQYGILFCLNTNSMNDFHSFLRMLTLKKSFHKISSFCLDSSQRFWIKKCISALMCVILSLFHSRSMDFGMNGQFGHCI